MNQVRPRTRPHTRPHNLEAWQAARLLARRELTAETLLQDCLEHIAEREPHVQAFAHLAPAVALATARALDASPWRGPLHGLPLGVKDLFDTADQPTAYGSPLYAGHQPAADAAAVALCRAAGAVLPGKTVSTEFAYFHPGPTHNPHRAGHTPGGSSSGSAAAVAACMLPLALGTQTAASIIRPAAFCGVVGYKPSLGRVPRAGVKSLSETLDTVGAFGRSVQDVALLGAVLCSDSQLLDETLWNPAASAPRIGLCPTPEAAQMDASTQAAWAQALAALAPHARSLADAAWPAALPDLVALQKAVMTHEMARSLSAERLQHRASLSDGLVQLFDEGMGIDGQTHAHHLAQVQAARHVAAAWFDKHDVLLAPSTIGEAPAGLHATGDPLFCRGWTLLGLPCVHLPFAVGGTGLPVGLQLVGRWGADAQLLAVAHGCWQRLRQSAQVWRTTSAG